MPVTSSNVIFMNLSAFTHSHIKQTLIEYSFLLTPLTNYHKLSDKQSKFVILEFLRSEVQHGSHWAKIKVLAQLHPFGKLSGRIYSLPSPVFRGSLNSLACGSLLPPSKIAA